MTETVSHIYKSLGVLRCEAIVIYAVALSLFSSFQNRVICFWITETFCFVRMIEKNQNSNIDTLIQVDSCNNSFYAKPCYFYSKVKLPIQ